MTEMTTKTLNYAKDNKERMPWEHYLNEFKKLDPVEVSNRVKIPYNEETQNFTLNFLGTTYYIHYPDFQVTHEDDNMISHPLEDNIYAKILICRYLQRANPTSTSGIFLSYRDIPWGETYFTQFSGRCIMRLAYKYGYSIETFGKIMDSLGAVRVSSGDIAYDLKLLDGLFIRFIIWAADDEFPPSAQILFSDNFPSSFTAEDLAYVGDICINTFGAVGKNLSK